MTRDSQDNFEYTPAEDTNSEEARKRYWAFAIGLQRVDGLEVSPYLKSLSEGYIDGTYGIEDTGKLIRAHHLEGETQDDKTKEADLVSQRIVELLASQAFALTQEFLTHIHNYLFQDLDADTYHPGEFKTERMIKQEKILNGDSVLYADPATYKMSLQAAFAREKEMYYQAFSSDELQSFCKTISFLWQIHPFYEGNTRAIAVFSELYLNHLGFDLSNDPFEKHAQFYRDALVRANYRNAPAELFPDDTYLIQFYESVLGQASHQFNNEDLICDALFENPDLLRNVPVSKALIK